MAGIQINKRADVTPRPIAGLARLLASFLLLILSASELSAREISSYAFINPDGSLRIDRRTVHLYGVYIPATNRTCANNRRPPVCGSRASVALELKNSGFVRCEILQQRQDRSLTGRCRVNASRFDQGEDLSAYLLQLGWAVALPDAPIEYQTLEKIARTRGVGVWGFPVDRIAPVR
ncbi:MAG: nuclease-like protein [Pseudomonadota bacterium]